MDNDRGSEEQDPSALSDFEPDAPSASAWSPPQFSLKGILLVMVLAGGFFAIVRYLGPEAAFPTIIVGGLSWLAIGCFRLFRLPPLGGRDSDEPET